MGKALVSIITPAWNLERHLPETIASVKAQTFADWELLIADDASTDGTLAVARAAAAADPRIRVLPGAAREGGAGARNRAIREAAGQYIAFLDGDDLWYPQKLEKQLALMRETGAALSYTGFDSIDAEGRRLGPALRVPARVTYAELLGNPAIGCSTAIYDSARLGKVYMPSIWRRQDFGLWLEILRRIPFAAGLDEPLAAYRVRPGSLSRNRAVAAWYTWRLYRDVERLPLTTALRAFCSYAWRGLRKDLNRSLAS